MEQGLILALPADDPLLGGARDQDLADNILPCGSKRKRHMITRYYLDACPHSLLSDPHLSQDDIVCAVLAENGLCFAWSSWSWRDGTLYVASTKPVVLKSQLDTLFGVARAIFHRWAPGSVRQADSVRRLNALLAVQLAERGWTSIAIVRHKDIPEHIDSLDEDLAFMISRAWDSSRATGCKLHLTVPPATLNTQDLWQAFNPLRSHSVTAETWCLSIVLYTAKRGIREEHCKLLFDLGFPGWNEEPVSPPASLCASVDTSEYGSDPSTVFEDAEPRALARSISPTIPFTGGDRVYNATDAELLYDPTLPGECVFQYEVVRLWDLVASLPLGVAMRCLLARATLDEAWFRDTRRWGCVVDIVLLAIAWHVSVKIVAGGSVIACIRIPGDTRNEADFACLGYNGAHFGVISGARPAPTVSVFIPDLTEEGSEPNPGPP
eukprot:3251408-Amphidinium_carterae.1